MARRVAVLALALLGSVAAKKSSAVVVIDSQASFSAAVAAHDFLVAEFYAPWCGHCKKLEPEWAKAAADLKAAGVPVTLAKADATLEGVKPLAEKYGVKGYPTIKMFRGHSETEALDYNGPREAAEIVAFLTKQAGPAVTALPSAEAAAAMAEKEAVLLLGVFPPGAEGATEAGAVFAAVAATLRDDFAFATVADAAHVPGGADGAGVQVLLLRKFDEPRLAVPEPELASAERLKAWFSARSAPRVVRLDRDPRNRAALQQVFEAKQPKVLLFAAEGGAATSALLASVDAAALAHPELKFITADPAENEGALSFFGIAAADAPAAVIHDNGEGDKKYVRAAIAADGLELFLAEFAAGTLVLTVKSEPVPADNSAPVTILVAKNFDAVVAPGVTALLEFYAPWCGHCKSLAPIYEKVGEHFADRADVVIAKMDATANDVPHKGKFDVKGFPTLYLQTAAGEVLPYQGERTEEALIAFVSKHLPGGEAAPAASAHDEL